MIKVYTEEESYDCNDVLFIDGLVECGMSVEDLTGFGVFGAVDEYDVCIFVKVACITASVAYWCWFLPDEITCVR